MNHKLFQRVEFGVGEGLQEFFALFKTAACLLKVQRAEAHAASGGQSGEFEESAAVFRRCLRNPCNLEILKIRAHQGELVQRPLINGVLLQEVVDRDLLQALLLVDRA